jgi:Spy/CpxP family protein refolding chaperone
MTPVQENRLNTFQKGRNMFRSKLAPLAAVALLSGSMLVFADDTTTTPPPEHHKHAKLTKPWSELKDLTDDEKSKIMEVHGKALEDIKAIHEKEKEDIMALLTDDQKKEVSDLEEKSPEKKSEAAPETQPAAK